MRAGVVRCVCTHVQAELTRVCVALTHTRACLPSPGTHTWMWPKRDPGLNKVKQGLQPRGAGQREPGRRGGRAGRRGRCPVWGGTGAPACCRPPTFLGPRGPGSLHLLVQRQWELGSIPAYQTGVVLWPGVTSRTRAQGQAGEGWGGRAPRTPVTWPGEAPDMACHRRSKATTPRPGHVCRKRPPTRSPEALHGSADAPRTGGQPCPVRWAESGHCPVGSSFPPAF